MIDTSHRLKVLYNLYLKLVKQRLHILQQFHQLQHYTLMESYQVTTEKINQLQHIILSLLTHDSIIRHNFQLLFTNYDMKTQELNFQLNYLKSINECYIDELQMLDSDFRLISLEIKLFDLISVYR